MCKFNEDEIIKYANDIINATFIEATLQDKDGNIIEQGLVNKDVIKGLLDLYQKEKEKNRELLKERASYAEEYIHNNPWLYKQLDELYIFRGEVDRKYISKDKIRDKIEYYKKIDNKVGITILEKILEK